MTALESARVCTKSDVAMENGSTPGAVPERYMKSLHGNWCWERLLQLGLSPRPLSFLLQALTCRVGGDAPTDMKWMTVCESCVGELLHGADLSLGCVKAWVCVCVCPCGQFFTPHCKG